MAQATDLGNGMYEVQWPDGSSYQVPEGAARQAAPDSFPDINEWAAQHGSGGNVEPVLPGAADPYSDQNLYETTDYPIGVEEMDFTQPPEEEMVFDSEPASIDPYANPYTPMGPEPDPELYHKDNPPWATPVPVDPALSIDGQLAAANGSATSQPQSRSQSSSESYGGTREYQRAPGVAPGAQPSFDGTDAIAIEAYGNQLELAESTKSGLRESMAKQEALQYEREISNAKTAAEVDRMHKESMGKVAEHEANLQESMANVSRMDMGKVFNDMGASGRAAGMIAAGIAGWLNPTGKNSAIEHMMQMVDQSAKEQAANISSEKFAIQGQERALGRFASQAKDSEQRYLDNRAMILSSVTAHLDQEKLKYSSLITIGNIDKMSIEAKRDLAKTLQSSKQQAYQNDFSERKEEQRKREFANNQARMRSQFNISRGDKLAAAGTGAAGPKGAFLGYFDGKALHTGPAASGVSDTELGKVRGAIKVENSLSRSLKEMQLLLHANKGRKWTPTDRAEVKRIGADVLRALRTESGANLTGVEVKLTEDFYGRPNDIIKDPETAERLLRDAVAGTASRLNMQIEPYGGQWEDGSRWDAADPLSGRYAPVDFAEAATESIETQMSVTRGHAKEFARATAEGRTEDAEESRKQAMMSIQQSSDVLERSNVNPDKVPSADAAREEISQIMESMGQPDFNDKVLGGIDETLNEQRERQDVKARIDKWDRDPSHPRGIGYAIALAEEGGAPFTKEEYLWWERNN